MLYNSCRMIVWLFLTLSSSSSPPHTPHQHKHGTPLLPLPIPHCSRLLHQLPQQLNFALNHIMLSDNTHQRMDLLEMGCKWGLSVVQLGLEVTEAGGRGWWWQGRFGFQGAGTRGRSALGWAGMWMVLWGEGLVGVLLLGDLGFEWQGNRQEERRTGREAN